MVNTLIESLKLKNTYGVNKIIYLLKKTIIGNLFSSKLYASKSTKNVGLILNILKSIISVFGGKLIIVGMILLMMLYFTQQGILIPTTNTFFNILFFFMTCEAMLQSNLLDKTEYSYYAIFFLKMDAKKYALSNYFWKMLLRIISFITAFIVLNYLIRMPIYMAIILPIYSVMLKTFFNYLRIIEFKRKRNIMKKIMAPIAFILLALSIGLPILDIIIPTEIIGIIFSVSFVLGIYSIFKLLIFNDYYKMYKKEFQDEANIENKRDERKEETIQIKKEIYSNENISSHGNKFLDELFLKRNKKRIYIVIILACLGLIASSFAFVSMTLSMPALLIELMPIIIIMELMLMFFVSFTIGGKYVETLYEKCDRAMLTFKSFRNKNVIMDSFKQRTKTIFKLISIPALLIIVQTFMVFKLGGIEFSTIEMILLILNIITMGIFSGINVLFTYYIVQPYSYSKIINNVKNTRPLTTFVSMLLLLIPIIIIYININVGLIFTLWFSAIIIFAEISTVKKKAYKTFKINE